MKNCLYYEDLESAMSEMHNPVIPLTSSIPPMSKMQKESLTEQYKFMPNKQIHMPVSVAGLLYSNAIKVEEFNSLVNGLKCMKPGEIASWNFFNKRKGINETIFIGNPMLYNDFEQFKAEVGEPILNLEKLPEGYSFKQAYICLYPDVEDTDNMARRKIEPPEEFKIIETCNVFQNYGVAYSNGLNSIILCANRVASNYKIFPNFSEAQSQLYDQIELLQVNGQTAMYRVFSKENTHLVSENGQILLKDLGGSQEIFWMHNKTTLIKLITDAENTISKEDLISVAESLEFLEDGKKEEIIRM